MKARIPYELGGDAKKEIRKQVNRQVIQTSAEYNLDLEAMIAWVLHKYFGFGMVRLLRFRTAFMKEWDELKERYKMDDAYPARWFLKNEVGYDVVQLLKEDQENEKVGTNN